MEQQFLSPHKNQRIILTASDVQVRSPINSKSIGGWRNYKDMLKPAISDHLRQICLKTYSKLKSIANGIQEF